MTDAARLLVRELQDLADPVRAASSHRYFKTGKGEYAEHETFVGIRVPVLRAIAKRYRSLSLPDIASLLQSDIHELRQCALFILVLQFERADFSKRSEIVDWYLSHLDGVNNWDLVDASAYQLLGRHLQEMREGITILNRLADSDDLWRQRIAVVATYAFIRAAECAPTMSLALRLLHHPHDLMQKAIGWMLREVGKKDEQLLCSFLDDHASVMPRTMLRYSIERLRAEKRRHYLSLPRERNGRS